MFSLFFASDSTQHLFSANLRCKHIHLPIFLTKHHLLAVRDHIYIFSTLLGAILLATKSVWVQWSHLAAIRPLSGRAHKWQQKEPLVRPSLYVTANWGPCQTEYISDSKLRPLSDRAYKWQQTETLVRLSLKVTVNWDPCQTEPINDREVRPLSDRA